MYQEPRAKARVAHISRRLRSGGARSAAFIAGLIAGLGAALAQDTSNPFGKINHVVVIYTENRSFDSLFGYFPGADGIEQAREKAKEQAIPPQVDTDGTLLALLPRVRCQNDEVYCECKIRGESGKCKDGIDTRFPAQLLNEPFPIDTFVHVTEKTSDMVHKFYQQQEQINGGRNDRFAAV